VVALPPAPAPALAPVPPERVGILQLPPLQPAPPGPAERLQAQLQPLQPLPRVGRTGVRGVLLLTPAPDGPVAAGCAGVPPTAPVTTLLVLAPPPSRTHMPGIMISLGTSRITFLATASISHTRTFTPTKFPCLTTPTAPPVVPLPPVQLVLAGPPYKRRRTGGRGLSLS